MNNDTKKVAINIGAGYTPGVNSIIIGAVRAAHKMGWEVVGIRDGFEGIAISGSISGWWFNITECGFN